MKNSVPSINLIPDWAKPAMLYLVWPDKLQDYICTYEVVKNYRTLLSEIPPHIPITIVTKNPKVLITVITKSTLGFGGKEAVAGDKARLQRITLPRINDIWLRDFMPLPAIDANGRTFGLKAIYRPKYLLRKEAGIQHQAGIILAQKVGLRVSEFPLVWDIGNLTHNGEGTAIVTKRILHDNPVIPVKSIRRMFRDRLGITKLVIIADDPEDRTGHIDWMVRFLGPKMIAVAKFPGECRELNQFMEKIKRKIERELGPGFKIVEVMNSLLVDEDTGDVGNAFGNHINFLRLGPDVLMLLVYNVVTDGMAMKTLQKTLPQCRIIPVDCSAISMKGGVLNCVSWCGIN